MSASASKPRKPKPSRKVVRVKAWAHLNDYGGLMFIGENAPCMKHDYCRESAERVIEGEFTYTTPTQPKRRPRSAK